ncbi:MAG: hypothetical protein CMM58_09735 [Rhodospirillaceae bacterium]|nr:hypothetical protein [Rhodospirillaceae bacterium]|tara:strand:+ start:8544 stop:8897 length:354 start_codon:yes stop_codon:yes gene_type:complete
MKGYATYAKVQPTKEGYRELEYRVLGAVTGALIKANQEDSELSEKFNAVLWNEKVWHAFRCDLSSSENELPEELKASLISLAIWVGKETNRVLDHLAGLDGLISINRQIMAGLSPKE